MRTARLAEIQRSDARAARRLVHEATRNQYDKRSAMAARRRRTGQQGGRTGRADFDTTGAAPWRLVGQSIDDNVERINCD